MSPVTKIRVGLVAAILALWQGLSLSGLFYRDVIPPLDAIAMRLARVLMTADFYGHLAATALEVGLSLAIGGVAGLAVGLVLGGSRLLDRTYEPYLHYLGPTPKIVFFPIMIMWFGVGPGSKVAMGALSCFFPIALSTAAGMRHIDRVLIRVGKSFGANTRQMVSKVYLPALRAPIISGARLGLGIAIIGVLLAETKLSNRGIGFLIIQSYRTFDMPYMYALFTVVFLLAAAVNAAIGRLDGSRHHKKR